MFVSHERSPSKKTFQKPNILRRKTKIPLLKALPSKPALVAPTVEGKPPELADDETASASHKPERRVQLDWCVTQGATAAALDQSAFIDDIEHNKEQEPVNAEAFLNGGKSTQYETEDESDVKLESHSLQKWQFNFGNAAEKIVIEPYERQTAADGAGAAPAPAAGDDVSIEHFITRPANFKCSAAGCSLQFATAQQLRRHGGAHAAVACPVCACARVFPARAALAAHLRQDHAQDDAPHRCGECGRRFFWAVGLRAHARAHRLARAPLACAWPGCGRAFRQPCRLREHARKHTGDKPYPCRHPGCGWAFRTASKLLRHARRHTGERKHACACGRAFNRREHLRDHQARHRRPVPRRDHPCPHPGCAQTFGSASALSAHARRAHDERARAAADPDTNTFMLLQGAGRDAGPDTSAGAGPGAGAGRSARTHLTWPLQLQPDSAATGEERELYAVRSDLFLPAADDTQQASSSPAGSPPRAHASPPHDGLGLLDLMQEELMYADAVDESSFQVLLLSEELG